MKKGVKILTLGLILTICMVGCQDKEAMAELETFKAKKALEEANQKLAERYIKALSDGNWEGLKEILAPDFAIYSPSGYPKPTSREKLIENYEAARKAFPTFTWNIEDIVTAKDKVICRIMIKGIFKGGTAGLPAVEKEFKLSLITIMRMEKGKIVEEWQEDDQLGFARQMGMELKPKAKDK